MPRVAVITSSPPFVEGGHLVISRALVHALGEAGYESSLIVTPQNRFGRQGAAYLATWLTDVGVTGDDRPIHQVISLRFPSYAVRHPNHVCWLNHTMREYYDQWDRFYAPLAWKGRIKERIRRRVIHGADRHLLKGLKRLFVQSKTIARRLEHWSGLRAEVLYPPAPQRPYRCGEFGDYVFAISRLTPLKRIDLLIEALSEPEARGIRCVIAGDGEEQRPLQRLIEERGLEGRVRLIGRISDAELVDHLAQCRAVCFPPYDEDYGFVTVEAFSSGKPVITCRDSGGAAELIVHERTGLIADASPSGLALALQRVMDDVALTRSMGEAASRVAAGMTWADAVHKLVRV